MRQERRIKPFLQYLENEWMKNPDLRFGQLLTNLNIPTDYNSEMEDYQLPFEVKRKITFWGKFTGTKMIPNYGPFATYKYIPLDKLKIDHIENILKTQKQIKGSETYKLLKLELRYRKGKRRRKDI